MLPPMYCLFRWRRRNRGCPWNRPARTTLPRSCWAMWSFVCLLPSGRRRSTAIQVRGRSFIWPSMGSSTSWALTIRPPRSDGGCAMRKRSFWRKRAGAGTMGKTMRKNKNLLESFNRAIDGLVYCFRTQRNLRIHFLAAFLVLALSLGLHLTKTEFLFVVLAIVLVLVTETLNTALEAAIDLFSPRYHPLAAVAKDVA